MGSSFAGPSPIVFKCSRKRASVGPSMASSGLRLGNESDGVLIGRLLLLGNGEALLHGWSRPQPRDPCSRVLQTALERRIGGGEIVEARLRPREAGDVGNRIVAGQVFTAAELL